MKNTVSECISLRARVIPSIVNQNLDDVRRDQNVMGFTQGFQWFLAYLLLARMRFPLYGDGGSFLSWFSAN